MGKGGDAKGYNGVEGKETRVAFGRKITMEEVQQHRTPEDAWMVFQNKVYDVSEWHDHPGGHVIFSHAGDDFTDIFAAFHPPSARDALAPFYIGELTTESANRKPEAQRKFEQAYRDLRSKLITAGMFKSSPLFYAYKCISTMAIWGASVACVLLSSSFMVHMIGAFLMALFWQQCGWLAHDFLHHQVFQNRHHGDLGGIFWGNVAQGFSVSWWKNKHNTHHAVPNLHASTPDAHDGDPDMDTMPVLAWSLKMASQAEKSNRFFIENQAILYFPILLIARVSWLLQSYSYAFKTATGVWETKGTDRNTVHNAAWEKAGLIMHYLWVGGLLLCLPWYEAILFFFVSETMCGFMLALVFGLGHNGMSVYDADARPDFWKLQVTTTRNVTSTLFTDWFCGGLQYQVDHHLFPQIPRHNLKAVHALVESFCKEHDVHYHEATMWKGTLEVLSTLRGISKEFIAEFPAM
ncbi:unnamed protein product [Chrysoparadoxa australica]